MQKRVLIIEDDASIAQLVEIHVKDLGFEVTIASNGIKGAELGTAQEFSLIILDLMLPGMDGNEVLKAIRKKNHKVPILMLTLKSELVDKVVSLELGADDYMTKPFSIQELTARIKALLRRSENSDNTQQTQMLNQEINIGEIRIDALKRQVFLADRKIELTPKQFDLLMYLATNPGRPFTRDDLLNAVWGYDSSGYEHTVDTHINRLRAQIEPQPSKPRYILTVWGVGYKFAEASDFKKVDNK